MTGDLRLGIGAVLAGIAVLVYGKCFLKKLKNSATSDVPAFRQLMLMVSVTFLAARPAPGLFGLLRRSRISDEHRFDLGGGVLPA